MNKLLEFLKSIWNSFKALFLGAPEEISRETPKLPEQQQNELQSTQQPQREVARAVPLDIASTDSPKYRKNKSLLTKPEHILYQALLHANNNEFKVFAKVRMGDFIFLANEPQDRKFYVNQVLCKHVDFLFCDNQSLEPLLVVELDDSSHKQYEHSERDEFKNSTFTAVGLPFLRIKVQQEYSSELLRVQIKEKIIQRQSTQYKN